MNNIYGVIFGMSETVDALQNHLRESIFHYANDGKKAAGRALGTIVEMITYYKLCSMGFTDHLMIETPVPEFGRSDITHNVEFSLHQIIEATKYHIERKTGRGVTARQLVASIGKEINRPQEQLISSNGIIRNSAIVGKHEGYFLVANSQPTTPTAMEVSVTKLDSVPIAIFECKRVGVEEGMKKGPQSIEKAKQGAYVARTVSALQKLRTPDGQELGFLPSEDQQWLIRPYNDMIAAISNSDLPIPSGFVLTVGVTSNHGNWFTSETMNKELRVLAGAYDWLLFLTDAGLLDFVNKMVLSDLPAAVEVRRSFKDSYTGQKGRNRFAKTRLDALADRQLREFFASEGIRTDKWFNVIQPGAGTLTDLRSQLQTILVRRPL